MSRTYKNERALAKAFQGMFRMVEKRLPRAQRRLTRMNLNQVVHCYIRHHGPTGRQVPHLELPEVFVSNYSVEEMARRVASELERQLLHPELDAIPGVNPDDYAIAWGPPPWLAKPVKCGHCDGDIPAYWP